MIATFLWSVNTGKSGFLLLPATGVDRDVKLSRKFCDSLQNFLASEPHFRGHGRKNWAKTQNFLVTFCISYKIVPGGLRSFVKCGRIKLGFVRAYKFGGCVQLKLEKCGRYRCCASFEMIDAFCAGQIDRGWTKDPPI